ncbi:MAG: hypothetical protein V4439_03220 [Patescibacteria group bacterium]
MKPDLFPKSINTKESLKNSFFSIFQNMPGGLKKLAMFLLLATSSVYGQKKESTIKENPPIYVSDIKDPRLLEYQDSLKDYDYSKKFIPGFTDLVNRSIDILNKKHSSSKKPVSLKINDRISDKRRGKNSLYNIDATHPKFHFIDKIYPLRENLEKLALMAAGKAKERNYTNYGVREFTAQGSQGEEEYLHIDFPFWEKPQQPVIYDPSKVVKKIVSSKKPESVIKKSVEHPKQQIKPEVKDLNEIKRYVPEQKIYNWAGSDIGAEEFYKREGHKFKNREAFDKWAEQFNPKTIPARLVPSVSDTNK